MNAKFSLSSTAALIADPSPAAILNALLDGHAFAAGELARAANCSAQSASMHLAQLLEGGLVKVAQEGRHRYYRIASTEVAYAIEALGTISSPQKPNRTGEREAIRYARTCYDHLAGELAVNLATAFEHKGSLVLQGDRDYSVTGPGEAFITEWQIDVDALRRGRRSFARRCLDWTERRDHVAGALGAAICAKLLEFRWIRRDRNSRVVHVTPAGRQNLESLLHSLRA